MSKLRLVVHPDISKAFPRQFTAVFGPAAIRPEAMDPAALYGELLRTCLQAGRAERAAVPPEIGHWEQIIRGMGAPSSLRSSVASLYSRCAETGSLRSISPVVDLYNTVSLAFLTPMAGYDAARIDGDLHLRPAERGERFVPLGSPDRTEKTREGEVVYADDAEVVCRYWNVRDCHKTRIGPDTREVVFLADLTAESRELALVIGSDIRARLEAGIQAKLSCEVYP